MTNFLEQQVEEKIRAAIATACAAVDMPINDTLTGRRATLTVVGFWQPSAAGTARGETLTGILVKILPRANVAYGSRAVILSGTVDVKITPEDSPTGDLLTELSGPVINLLNGWNLDPSALESALNITGVFRVDGFMFHQGGDADFDFQELGVWYAKLQFQIRGHIPAVTA